MSTQIVRYLGCCTLAGYCVLASWFCQLGQTQEPSPAAYAGLPPAAARTKFERAVVEVRREQRQALQAARQELQSLAVDEQLDQKSRDLIEQLVEQLFASRDYLKSLELVLRVRGQLNNSVRPAYDNATARLSDKWAEYQQCKQEYQRAVGQSLVERWPQLSLESKRCELSDYLALADQRPAWLMRGSPINIVELVPKSAQQPINQYLAEKRDLIRSVQDQLQPKLDDVLRTAKEAATDPLANAEQRAAAQHIATILEAPYTRGLRGVALCQPTDDLPDKLRLQIHALLTAYLQRIQSITPAHGQLLHELNTRLESGQRDRLASLKFDEQMAIDLYLAQITHVIEPIRILASRTPRSNYYEDAKVLELTKSGDSYRYRVEFVIDGVSQWIAATQTRTRQPRKNSAGNSKAVSTEGSEQSMTSAPGQPVTNITNFDSGQVFAHCPAGWKPVIVVDESSMGVVIRWHGAADPIEFTLPRDQLRIVPSQDNNEP